MMLRTGSKKEEAEDEDEEEEARRHGTGTKKLQSLKRQGKTEKRGHP